MKTELSASMEDYLEAIFRLSQSSRVAHVTEIAQQLGVKNASVTSALQSLASKKLVNYQPYKHITLTGEGYRIARDVAHRHETLRNFFVQVLSIDSQEADQAACEMEHTTPPKLIKRLTDFAAFIEHCPRTGSEWIERFTHMHQEKQSTEKCKSCLERCISNFESRKAERQGV